MRCQVPDLCGEAHADVTADLANPHRLIVKAQGSWRKNGIPATAVLKYSEYRPGSRHVATMSELVAAMSPEDKAKLVAELSKK